ncbi:MAG: hypothetical protein ABMA64_20770, partial [Myxococcota bacterium]
MWSDRITAAQSVEARRELLAEAARWRAQHLGDVPAMRRATYAISRLLALVGDHDRAVGEGRQLVSLLQTAPEASEDELEAARGHLSSLGLQTPRNAPAAAARRGRDRERPARPERPERGDRRDARPNERVRALPERPGRPRRDEPMGRPEAGEPRGTLLPDARRAAAVGDYDQAIAMLDGIRGGAAGAVRVYARLSAVLAGPDPLANLGPVREELARLAAIPVRSEVGDGSDPLSQLIGETVPAKRVVRIRMIEEFAEAHPERIDELAAAALRHHLAVSGPGAGAPWLVGVVAKALGEGDAPNTTQAIGELRAAASVAAAAYDEWPFERSLRLRKRAVATGFAVGGLRRGVLSRGEPDDRKLWTLRLARDGVERMVAIAPHATAPYEAGKVEELAPRLRELCPATLLLATGSGNAGLRAAAAAAGCAVLEHDADDDALLTAVTALSAAAPSAGPSGPSAPDRLVELLQADDPSVEALTEVLRGFRRPDRALRVVHRMSLDDTRTAAILRAVDAATEEGRPLPEVTTLAVVAAATGPKTRALLTHGGPLAKRFAGPEVEVVADLAKVLVEGGWQVHRVLRGPTRREVQAHPALETFSDAMNGLWRLLVRSDERKGEVWYLGALPPEGRAGVPL